MPNTPTNGHTGGTAPEITLYTNHGCPWAHRAHIALAELGLHFKEEIVDLSTPRTASYLAINPRGLVPTLVYSGEIIPESAIAAQFLVDANPSHLVKTSSEPGGALERARINFFADAVTSKLNPPYFAGLKAQTAEEKEQAAKQFVDAVVKEVEPLLKNASPFFGGSSRLTLAEVLTGSFALRYLAGPKHGLAPLSLLADLEARAPRFWKWAHAVVKEKSVNYIWDEKAVIERTKARFAKLQAEAK